MFTKYLFNFTKYLNFAVLTFPKSLNQGREASCPGNLGGGWGGRYEATGYKNKKGIILYQHFCRRVQCNLVQKKWLVQNLHFLFQPKNRTRKGYYSSSPKGALSTYFESLLCNVQNYLMLTNFREY